MISLILFKEFKKLNYDKVIGTKRKKEKNSKKILIS